MLAGDMIEKAKSLYILFCAAMTGYILRCLALVREQHNILVITPIQLFQAIEGDPVYWPAYTDPGNFTCRT